ncbi:MAG: HD domain-containing protein [Haliscomenobacter sp.]|nr:HD domain-containing protein [Haliscomenobacter sp.]
MTHMDPSTIRSKAEHFVIALLKDNLGPDYLFHDVAHTLSVRDAALKIGQKEGLSETEMEVLELAALFHDTGFVDKYLDHETASQRIAREFLESLAYPADRLNQVLQAIGSTRLAQSPSNLLEQTLRDADMSHLGSPHYAEYLKALRREWAVFLQQQYADPEWLRLNLEFLKGQVFYTPGAWAIFGAQRDENLKHLKKKAKQLQKNAEEKKEPVLIQENRSAQMMFKAALRNHIDLSSLADNKANMMLSVNALIITIVVPLTADRVQNTPNLVFPLGVLLLSCLTSMVFATLATRPIRMSGYTSMETIRQKKSNLFFFGNFFRMNFEEYKSGVELVLGDHDFLEDTIQRDLFFLGKSLGVKYQYLRVCYTIFMWGILATVILFGLIFLVNINGLPI